MLVNRTRILTHSIAGPVQRSKLDWTREQYGLSISKLNDMLPMILNKSEHNYMRLTTVDSQRVIKWLRTEYEKKIVK